MKDANPSAGKAEPLLAARIRRAMEHVRERQRQAGSEPAESDRVFCGRCRYGWIVENGRARKCDCQRSQSVGLRQEFIDQLLARHRAGMPKRLARVSAHTFLIRPGHEHIKPALDQYIKDMAAGKRYGFLIFGKTGVGKSYAAAYVVNTIRFQRIMTAAMVNFSRMLSALRSTFKDADEQQNLLTVLYDTPLLAIDDLGMEQRVSENPELSWSVSEFYKVIDYRRDESLPTLITTNRTIDELKDRLGEPIMERIKTMTLRMDIKPVDET